MVATTEHISIITTDIMYNTVMNSSGNPQYPLKIYIIGKTTNAHDNTDIDIFIALLLNRNTNPLSVRAHALKDKDDVKIEGSCDTL